MNANRQVQVGPTCVEHVLLCGKERAHAHQCILRAAKRATKIENAPT